MQLNFRQGLVYAPTNFLQLSGGQVTLNVVIPDTVVVTIADGDSNYLIVERVPVNNAWTGPFTPGTDAWIYWDIDVRTGSRTFGHTTIAPHEGNTPPSVLINGIHWFDTNVNYMKVWNATASRWVKVLRVFAAKVQSGATLISMSINAPTFTGTQIGSLHNIPVVAGSLIFDTNGDPLKVGNGKFITTEDVVVSDISTAAQIKIGALLIDAVAEENIPAYSLVRFSNFHRISLANNLLLDQGPYGIVERNVNAGEIVPIALEGLITNPAWDWTAGGVNAPLFVNASGALSLTPIGEQTPVAFVIDKNTILLRPSIRTIELGGAGAGASTLNDLSDVVTTGAVTGQYLTYDGASWTPTSFVAPSYALNDLTDVTSNTPAADTFLRFNGTNWAPASLPTYALGDLTDVTSTAPTTGQHLAFNGSEWTPTTFTLPSIALNDLSDVNATPTTNDVLTFNGTGWIAAAPQGGGGGGSYTQYQAVATMTTIGTTTFGGALYGTWTYTPKSTAGNTYVSFGGTPNAIRFLQAGLYEVTFNAKLVCDTTPEPGLIAYGMSVSPTNASIPNNSVITYHTRTTDSSIMFGLGFGPTHIPELRSVFTWTDNFVVESTSTGFIEPYVFAYQYNNMATETLAPTIDVVVRYIGPSLGV